MKLIYFTKFLKGWTQEQIAERALALGFDGLDLAVRAGQCVNPENAATELPRAVRAWKQQGLTVPLVTLEGNWTDPDLAALQTVYRACGDAGVPFIKLGYWHWRPGQPYWEGVDAIRRALAEIAALSADCGICSLVHTHSGSCYGSNASGAMALVRDFDPRSVALYLDPAHLALNGEPLPMALAIASGSLRFIAAKNARYLPTGQQDGARYRQEWCLLEEGLVDWRSAIGLLRGVGYDGAISLHGEYSMPDDAHEILKRVAVDVRYLRGIIEG